MTNEELWAKIHFEAWVRFFLLGILIAVCASIIIGAVQASADQTLSVEQWDDVTLARYDHGDWFLASTLVYQETTNADEHVTLAGKAFVYPIGQFDWVGELALVWHEVEWKDTEDDDLSVAVGTSVRYRWESFLAEIGWRYAGTEVDDDKRGRHRRLNGATLRLGWRW